MARALSSRVAHGLGWAIGGLSVALAAAGLVLAVITWSTPLPANADDQAGTVALMLAFLLFALMGALILYFRPANRIGSIFSAMGVLFLGAGTLDQYAIYALNTHPGSVPGGVVVAWASGWLFLPGLFGIFLLFLVFPDGRLLSRRWVPVAAVGAVGVFLLTLGAALAPGELGFGSLRKPFSLQAFSFLNEERNPGWFAFLIMPFAGLTAIFIRWRRSKGDERRKLKLFAYAIIFLAVSVLLISVLSEPASPTWALILFAVALAFVPISAAIGILRYSLYEIEFVISRALVYGVLAAFITAIYVGIVVGVGTIVGRGSEGNIVLSLVATAIVALAIQPLRERARHLANRIVYGNRATPYEVLSSFSERMGGSYASEDLVPEMARILGEGTGASRSEAWLRVGDELRRVATWPTVDEAREAIPISNGELPDFPLVSRAVAVRHRGELLGALTVTKPPSDPFSPIEDKLLADLASQAGLVLRNARLTAELQERLDEITAQAEELRRTAAELRDSRQRLVKAQDEERRRLERNLHDGAQQQLVALAVKQRLVEGLLERDPEKAKEMLTQLQADTTDALNNLRELARGIYPPLLADQGLAAALRAQARKSPIPVDVRADGVGRFSQEAEAAVYFCVLEALQNVNKYSKASSVIVQLETADDSLRFAVSDDGQGFDKDTTKPGSGLTNMADRMAALGGSLTIDSAVGQGTVVSGRVATGIKMENAPPD
jgi:signal transduction histidine kinase